MDTNIKRTYFGFAALLTGIISDVFIGANIGVSYLEITPALFSQLNVWTAQIYCISTPLAFILGILGFVRQDDSKILSSIAIVLVAIPFTILLIQLASSFLR
ncbi:MAG: hypothetical protein H7Y59_14990 [Anaerolineales bacterium]|nr:hypothetical protein [Anaerolineales bacterium]